VTSHQRHVYLTPVELHVLASAISSDRGYELAEGETEAAERLWGLGFIEVDDRVWAVAQPLGREYYEAFIRRPAVSPEEASLARGLGLLLDKRLLSDAEADLFERIVDTFDETYEGLYLEGADLQTAQRLQDLDYVDINPKGIASPTEEGYDERSRIRAVRLNRDADIELRRLARGSAGALLETLLTAGDVPVDALMRQRQNLGRSIQRHMEEGNPLDLCGEAAWKLAALPQSDLVKELQGVRCGRSQTAPALVKAGLARSVDGDLRLTERPARWHLTQAGNLRIDGADVASGPTRGLRALGSFLHDVGYPRVTAQHRLLFRVGRPGVPQELSKLRAAVRALRDSHVRPETMIAPDWIRLSDAGREPARVELSPVTAQLIRRLALDGGQASGAGVYLGLSEEQWDVHAGETQPSPPGPWAMEVLRILPAHPRVIGWVLHLEEPLGGGVVYEFLLHLQRRGLANRRLPNEWCLTPQGQAAIEGEGRLDPIALWAEHRDHGEAAELPSFRVIVPDLQSELERRIGEAGESWRADDAVRAGFITHVLSYLNERHLGHGCELAYALWSRAASGGVCLSEKEVAFMNRAIEVEGVDLTQHGTDLGRLESLGYVEVSEHLALPLGAGRDATRLYEPTDFGWEE